MGPCDIEAVKDYKKKKMHRHQSIAADQKREHHDCHREEIR